MIDQFVDIHLDVEVQGEVMLARLVFANNNPQPVYLDSQTICIDHKTRRNIFSIIDELHNKSPYKGMMIKRVIVPEDFITLSSGDKIETSVALNEVYKVQKGNKYSIQYAVIHPGYIDETAFAQFKSNVVEVVY